MNNARVVPLFKITSRGEVRPQGGEFAPTMAKLFEWFELEVMENPLMAGHFRSKTKANYRRTMTLMLQVCGDDHPSNLDILRAMQALAARPFNLKPGTVHAHYRALRSIYSHGCDAGKDVVSGNPCRFLQVARPERTPQAIHNIEQVLPLLLNTLRDDRERAFVLCERFIGRRRGEVIGLTRNDLVREAADCWRIEVVAQRPDPNKWDRELLKNSRGGERAIPVKRGRHPLWPVLEELLQLGPAKVKVGHGGQKQVEAPHGLLFPYRENDLNRMMRGFRAVAPLAFPKGRAWHVFRHTLALEMNRAGKGDQDIAEALGHASTATTRGEYGTAWGLRIRESVFSGMWKGQQPTIGAGPPVEEASGPKKRTPPVAAGGVQRRSKAGSPPVTKESKRCDTPSRSVKSQPRLPGMQVQAVQVKPSRAGTASRSATAKSTPRKARSGPPPVEWSGVVTFGAAPCPF